MRLQRDFFLTVDPAGSGPDYSYLPGVAAHPRKWRVLMQRDLASRLIAAYSRPGALDRIAAVLKIGRCPGRPGRVATGVPAGASARRR
jgi:hypothetical protein